jgi:octaprenyl-diphosphate synthase
VILSAKKLGKVNDHVLYAAAALEMLHNASLIHDDVVDETKLRRGVPTINNTWDNHIAVLVGDFFVSTALSVGIHTGRISVLGALSELGKELSLGEIDQICNAQERHLNETAYLSVIRKKTASLFMKCVQLGAETGDARPEDIAPMVDYAELLGLCFQIKDDIFDYFEDEKIGKPTGNDLREGKVTLPLLYALNHGKGDDVKEMNDLVQRGDLSEEEIARLIEFAKREGGIDYAYAKMHDMQRQADEIICRYPDNDARKAFRDIFEFIIHRDK